MLSYSLQVTVGVPGGLCGPQSGPPETPCISLLQSSPRPGLGWGSDDSLLGTFFHSVRTKAPGRGAEWSLKPSHTPLAKPCSRPFSSPKRALCTPSHVPTGWVQLGVGGQVGSSAHWVRVLYGLVAAKFQSAEKTPKVHTLCLSGALKSQVWKWRPCAPSFLELARPLPCL